MQTILAFIIIFGALVFFHELGHFIFARRAGILCREFAIGFGPKVFSHIKGETTYTIRLLPIGGYVRMAGEDPEMVDLKPGHRIGVILDEEDVVQKLIINQKDQYANARRIEVEEADLEHKLFVRGMVDGDEEQIRTFSISREAMIVENGIETRIAPFDRQFGSKTLPQRTMAIFAGPMMNFVLAFVVFLLIGIFQGVPTDAPKLGAILEDGAASSAGLQQGDTIQSINGEEMASWTEIRDVIQANPAEELTFTILRDESVYEVKVTPEPQTVEDPNGEQLEIGLVGVQAPTEKDPLGIVSYGFTETAYWTKEIIYLLGQLVTGQFSIDMLNGPVGIYVTTDEVAQTGLFNLMKWSALLSINLGIMNLLPIPALDGGRLLFFLVEAIRGKPIDRHKEGMVHFVGFALIMLLMLVVTWNDIQRFFL
ncbi:RIP metalloprotease RseP [Bacillus fonticola]|uniref:RIP metalloprotease RseP n=1 Tax=Bacillus fonticola TaxID=2728853 RepID=UPI001475BA6F|nr:RIP metalloprotease RseP [Bacillus fonticola]